jgi:hypothetical protein
MNIQDDIKALHNHETFARFIKMVYELREETIQELHEASSDTIQQVSGRIITYDQILQLANWEQLKECKCLCYNPLIAIARR